MSPEKTPPKSGSVKHNQDLGVSGIFDSFFTREKVFKDLLADVIRVRASSGTAPLRDEEGGPFNELFAAEDDFPVKERDENYAQVAAKMLPQAKSIFEDPNEYNFFLNFYREASARIIEAPGALNEKLIEDLLFGTARAISKERDLKALGYLLDTANRFVLAEGDLAHGRSSYTFTRFLARIEKGLGESLEAVLPDIKKNISGEVEGFAAEMYTDLMLQTWPKNIEPFYDLCRAVSKTLAIDESLESLSDDARARLAEIEERLLRELSRGSGVGEHLEFWKEMAEGPWGDYREIQSLKALYSFDPKIAMSYVGRIISEADEDDLRETRARIIYWLRKDEDSETFADSIANLGRDRADQFMALARQAIFYEDGFKIYPRDLDLLAGLRLMVEQRLA